MTFDIAVILAGVAAMVFGFIWYHPKVLGGMWMKLTKTKHEKKDGMAWRSFLGLIAYIVMAYVLKMFFGFAGVADVSAGIKIALWLWLGFIGTVSLGSVLWDRKPFKLWVLNNVYHALALVIMAWVLLSWA